MQVSNLTKIRPVGAQTQIEGERERERERERDMTKLIVGFRNFVNPPTNFFGTLWALVFTVREEEANERVGEIRVDDTANSKLQSRDRKPGHTASN